MESIKFDYDFNKLDIKQIVEYIYFFEQTKIDKIEQVSQIINILKNNFSNKTYNCNKFFIVNFSNYINDEIGIEMTIYEHFINLHNIFTNNDTCVGKNLLIELANVYLILFNQLTNEFDVYNEKILFDFIKNVILIKKFINQKNHKFYKEDNEFCNQNIFNELLYLIDKFFFDMNNMLSNKIIDDLKTIVGKEKYNSIIATLDDYFIHCYEIFEEKGIFKDLVEKTNIKIFDGVLLSDISNLEKDKLTMYFHDMYHK